MTYIKTELLYLLDMFKALPTVNDASFVGRIELCGEAEHDVDILLVLNPPVDWQSKTPQELAVIVEQYLNDIVDAIGQKDNTERAMSYIGTGNLDWLGYNFGVELFSVPFYLRCIRLSNPGGTTAWTVEKQVFVAISIKIKY